MIGCSRRRNPSKVTPSDKLDSGFEVKQTFPKQKVCLRKVDQGSNFIKCQEYHRTFYPNISSYKTHAGCQQCLLRKPRIMLYRKKSIFGIIRKAKKYKDYNAKTENINQVLELFLAFLFRIWKPKLFPNFIMSNSYRLSYSRTKKPASTLSHRINPNKWPPNHNPHIITQWHHFVAPRSVIPVYF